MKLAEPVSVPVRLGIGFGIMLIIFAGMIAISYTGLMEIGKLQGRLYTDDFENMTSILALRSNLNAERLDMAAMLEAPKDEWRRWRRDLDSLSIVDSVELGKLESGFIGEGAQTAALSELTRLHKEFRTDREARVLNALDRGDVSSARMEFHGRQTMRHQRMGAILERLEQAERLEALGKISVASAKTRQRLYLFLLFGGVFAAITVLLAVLMTRMVTLHLAEQKRSESKLAAANRELKMLNACIGIGMHSPDESHLLQETCNAIVSLGAYAFAWIGYAVSDEEKSVRPVSFAGEDGNSLRDLTISWGESPRAGNPTGTCIRTGRPVRGRCSDYSVDEPVFPPREAGKEFNSFAAFPLWMENKVYGALTIYSETADAFDTEESGPLAELAESLSLATAVLRDRSARLKAEKRWRSASLYARSLIEASLDPLLTINPEGKITDVSIATEKITGRCRAELIGTDFCDYFTEPEKARTGYLRVFNEGSVHDYELEMKDVSGKSIPVTYNASLYRDETGRTSGAFAAARDLSVRKRDEGTIRLQSDQYRAILATSADGFWRFDAEGRLLDVNDAYCRMSGYTREDLMRMKIAEIEAVERPDEVDAHIRSVKASGFDRFESRHRRRDGTVFDVEVSVSYSQDTDRFVLFARDISGRKKSEEELRQRLSELERFSRMSVGRELRMIELKKEVNELSRGLRLDPPYPLEFAGKEDDPVLGGKGNDPHG